MLYGVGGTPGAGKTLWILHFLRTEKMFEGRPLYVNGVDQFDFDYFGAKPLENARDWVDCPDGSVIFIDECHESFPPLKPWAEKPDHYARVADHRHRGIDLVMATQVWQDVDSFLRGRMWRYFYIHRWDGSDAAKVFEYKDYQRDPMSKGNKLKRLSQKEFKYPTDLYEKYHSAEIHTPTVTRPWWHYGIPVMIVIGLIFAGIVGYQITQIGEMAVDEVTEAAGTVGLGQGVPSPRGFRPPGVYDGGAERILSASEYVDRLKPRVVDMPWSAPLYDRLTEPKDFPRPQCYRIEDTGECRCFTQQATRLNISEPACNHYVDVGWFDATRDGGRSAFASSRPESGSMLSRIAAEAQ
jgi:hypothetical protein